MALYELVRGAHVAAGSVALATFWITAALRKGTRLHRRIGGAYLLSMLAIVATALPLAAQAYARGHAALGTFLLYLVLITATAMWTAWRAIRDRRARERYFDVRFRALAYLNVAASAVVVALGIRSGGALLIGMSTIGFAAGAQMLRLAAAPPTAANWWLTRHYTGIVGCGIATHIAFLNLGLHRLLPGDYGALATYAGWFGPVLVAVLALAWLGRRYGRGAADPSATARRSR